MAIPFQNELITAATLLGVAIAGYFQIIGKLRRDREESEKRIFGRMDEKTDHIIDSLGDRLETVDSRFGEVHTRISKEEEDIEDVEDDMKNMISEFKAMCEKLQKHDFILQDVLPDFKSLQKEFINFKTKVEARMSTNSNLVNTNEVERNRDGDSENR